MGAEDIKFSEGDTIIKEAHPGLISVRIVRIVVVEGLRLAKKKESKKIKQNHVHIFYIIL